MRPKWSWLISCVGIVGLVLAFNNCDGFSVLNLNPESSASQTLTDVRVDSGTSGQFWDQARDRGGNALASGNALEPGADSCEIVGDFPIRTHYRNGVGPSPGGTDVPELFNKNVGQEVASGQPMVRIYSNGYTPRHASYLEDNYDSQLFSDDAIKSALRHLCVNGAMRVRFRQTSAPITSTADIQNLIVPNERSFQVLHGLIFRRNLFTVIVPPMWNSSVSLATLVHNGYSLNHQLANSVGVYGALRQAYAADTRGAIGILWNGGGATASYTISNDAYRDFNDFARLLTTGVGVDANKVVTMGGSRGGHGSLGIASHPLVTSVRVAYAYATAPPSDWELQTSLSSTTLPAMLPAIEGITGYVGGWRSTFRSPDLGVGTQDAFLLSQTGTTNRSQIAANFSLVAPARIAKLRNGSTSILLGITSHDFIVPTIGQWRLAKTYRDAGLDVEVERHFLCGHGNCTYRSPELGRILARLNASISPRSERFVTPGLVRDFVVNATTGVSEPKSATAPAEPLTLEFPRVVLPDVAAPVLGTGRPGSSVVVVLYSDSERRDFGFVMRFDAAGTARYDFPTGSLPQGAIRLQAVYELDDLGEPRSRFTTVTNVKGNPQIVFERYDLDTRPLGRDIPMRIFVLFAGNDFENAYVNPSAGVGHLMNYGVIEVGKEAVSQQDIISVRRVLGRGTPTPSPTPGPTPVATPTPAPAVGCSASTAEVVFDSPNGSNSCRVSWSSAKVGETVRFTALSTNGGASGSLEGTCIGRENWNFSYYCPNKVGVTCGGGRAVIPSIPSGVRECTFRWDQASQGNVARILSNATEQNGGLIDGVCDSTGWTFGYQCADPGVKVCSGGAASIPSASGGRACVFNWPHTVIGQSYSGKSDGLAGSAGGTIKADCVDEGGVSGAWRNIQAVCP